MFCRNAINIHSYFLAQIIFECSLLFQMNYIPCKSPLKNPYLGLYIDFEFLDFLMRFLVGTGNDF